MIKIKVQIVPIQLGKVFPAICFRTWDRINPLDWQKEGFLQLSFGQRDVRIHVLQQLHHCIYPKFRLFVLQ